MPETPFRSCFPSPTAGSRDWIRVISFQAVLLPLNHHLPDSLSLGYDCYDETMTKGTLGGKGLFRWCFLIPGQELKWRWKLKAGADAEVVEGCCLPRTCSACLLVSSWHKKKTIQHTVFTDWTPYFVVLNSAHVDLSVVSSFLWLSFPVCPPHILVHTVWQKAYHLGKASSPPLLDKTPYASLPHQLCVT